jgi:hypothetical protein
MFQVDDHALSQRSNQWSDVCRMPWAWVATQRELVSAALSGLALSLALAYLVLNISTGNIILASLAMFSVLGIMATSLGIGIVGIMDWSLGLSESISVVILIGFSMDYALHLAGALWSLRKLPVCVRFHVHVHLLRLPAW